MRLRFFLVKHSDHKMLCFFFRSDAIYRESGQKKYLCFIFAYLGARCNTRVRRTLLDESSGEGRRLVGELAGKHEIAHLERLFGLLQEPLSGLELRAAIAAERGHRHA